MLQIYLFFISGFLLVVIFLFQGKRLKRLEALKARVAEKINAKRRAEKITQGQQAKQESQKRKSQKESVSHQPEIKALLKQIDMDMIRNKLDHAETLLVQLLALDSKHQKGREQLAQIYLLTQREKKAEIIYKELTTEIGKNPTNFANMGLCQYRLNNYTDAIKSYERSIVLDPKNPKRYVAVGQIYLLTKKPKKALENFEKALRRDRRNVDYIFLIAETYRQMGEMVKFKENIEKILKFQPYNQDAKEELRKLTEQKIIGEIEVA